jgi:uncharacterized membrane protein YbaN (DUF454 family)
MKLVFIVVGVLALGLGAVGVVLPIVPTTPLLLLAAICFAKSSKRLNDWFKNTKLYQNNLESFVRGEGMTKKSKAKILITITIIMVIAFLAMRNTTIGRICLAVVWLCHIIGMTVFVKTCPKEAAEKVVEFAHDD